YRRSRNRYALPHQVPTFSPNANGVGANVGSARNAPTPLALGLNVPPHESPCMSRFQLVLRSVSHHWRTNLAVLLGVVAGTAVIGGALIVGDSVRASLVQMTLDR